MAFSLRARVVFAVDRPAIAHGVVTVDGGRIAAVGAKPQASRVIDLGDVALLPGLVNAHTHLEFSHLRRPLGSPGMRLVDWIRLVLGERGRGADAAGAIEAGLAESLRCGVTMIGQIATIGTDNPVGRPRGGPEGPPPGVDVVSFCEVIGFSRARAESALAAVCERLARSDAAGAARVGLSPHAPYTVSPDLLGRLIALAGERGAPVAMHVAESAEELELLASGGGPFQELLEERSMWDTAAIPRGSRPMDYLRMLAGAPRSLVIHGNYLDAEEREFLAANAARMSLVYCPRTHAYFEHPPYPLAELVSAGVRVALGTDSRASNPDLDMLAEMRFAARRFPALDPQEILRMGTLAGAEALGIAAEMGSITPGKTANLVAVPVAANAGATPEELAAVLGGSEPVSAVWLQGREMAARDL